MTLVITRVENNQSLARIQFAVPTELVISEVPLCFSPQLPRGLPVRNSITGCLSLWIYTHGQQFRRLNQSRIAICIYFSSKIIEDVCAFLFQNWWVF